MGDGCGYLRDGRRGQRDLRRIVLGEMGEDARQDVAQEGHDGKVVFDKAKLYVQTDIFVDVTNGVVGFGAKDRADFKDALKDAYHHLLVELGALCEISRASEVVYSKDVGSAFSGGSDELWALNFETRS